MKYPKYFSQKMNTEKSIFHFEKQILELIGNSLAYHRIFGFWKGTSGQTISKGKSVSI